jgi:putative oxidoreductase
LLLRVVSGVATLLQGGAILLGADHPAPIAWVTGLLIVVGGAALLVGFLTPVASAIVALGITGVALDGIPLPPLNLFEGPLSALLVVTIAAATGCLGPGAFSLDAMLFGRREVLIRR